ncbi:MAG: ferredoxin [Patescibacteria group bacterium]|nr:ferredoxin [Patescibacteria group bacterium]
MKIILDKSKCIGCGVCASICDKYFSLDNENKSRLKGGKINSKTGQEELEIENSDCAEEAVSSCPAQCIEIKK